MAEDEEKRMSIPANEIGEVLRKNGIACTEGTAKELAELATVVNDLVKNVGTDPEKVIEDIEQTVSLNDIQKKAIRAQYASDVKGITAENKNTYRYTGTSMNTVAKVLREMVG